MTGRDGKMHAGVRTTLALALVAPLATAGSLATAQPAQAEPAAPAAVKTLLTDVDGDRTYDTVQLFELGSDAYRLTVTTTKGVISSVEFTSQPGVGWHATQVLYGAATLDGAKGSELIVQLWNRELLTYRDDVDLAVYTWRSGRLVAEKAPKSSYLTGWHFGGAYHRNQSYHFFDKSGRRYVDVAGLTWKGGRHPYWAAKVTRSLWRNGAWVKVSTRATRYKIGATATGWYSGPPVLLGQALVDIDGDAAVDELRSYRYEDDGVGGAFRLKVTTATGKVVARNLRAYAGRPLLGAAPLDGVPGSELVFDVSSEDPLWQVITWRKGKLVFEPSPGTSGSKAMDKYWIGCGDESGTTLTFSTAGDGSRHLVRTCTGEDLNTGDPLTTSSDYVWRGTTWVYVSSWTGRPTPEEDAALGRGIQGVTLITP